MRGADERSGALFSYVDLEARGRGDHPVRAIRVIVNEALAELAGEFAALYSVIGRPSIPPEKLLRAMLLQAFYSIRSERQLMERLEFDLLFRWFVGIGIDDPVWDHLTFFKNRDRLLDGDIAEKFLAAVLAQSRVKRLLSREQLQQPKDGQDEPPTGGGRNGEANFRGERRSNETHASTTDPDARLYRKGPGMEAKLCFIAHGLMENRSGRNPHSFSQVSRRSRALEEACLSGRDFADELRSVHLACEAALRRLDRLDPESADWLQV